MSDKLLDFDDVLIEPQFSFVRSRKDVNVSTDFLGLKLSLPILNSNMDTVASPELCRALAEYGTVGTLHRFWPIDENVQAFKDSIVNGVGPIVSIGIGRMEFRRTEELFEAGAKIFILDVAHAANIAVVEMYNQLTKEFPIAKFIVGDFGTGAEIIEFLKRIQKLPDAIKVGIGVGSVCHTKLVTGVGNAALSCLIDCAEILNDRQIETKLILDGGVSEIGDIAKALIAGADIIMSGSMFAGTDEAAGELITNPLQTDFENGCKIYRGSASLPSYKVQGKEASWRAPEGTSIMVDHKGPVINVLNNINGGLRSACSYTNSFNLKELKLNAKFTYK